MSLTTCICASFIDTFRELTRLRGALGTKALH
jgi:hypothetical protein